MLRVAWPSSYREYSDYVTTNVSIKALSSYLSIYLTSFVAQKRKLLAAAASAGVSVAFGSPLGGVLFGLEELDTFAFSGESDVMWRGFVTSVIAAVSLQYVDPFGTSKLVLFQVSGVSDTVVHGTLELPYNLELGRVSMRPRGAGLRLYRS